MPKLLFSICSESVNIDALTNNVSLFNIVESIKSTKFPATFYRMFVTSLWQRDPGEEGKGFESKVQLVEEGGRVIREWHATFKFEKPHHRHFIMIRDIQFEKPGVYTFEVFIRNEGISTWDEEPVHRIPIILSSVPELPNVLK